METQESKPFKGVIYEATCHVTNKKYRGKHEGEMPLGTGPEEYPGSGKLLIKSLKKHGKENHTYEILNDSAKNSEELSKLEEKYVDEEWCNRADTLNIAPGGTGGNTTKFSNPNHYKEMSEKGLEVKYRNGFFKRFSDAGIKAQAEMRRNGLLNQSGEKNPMYGKKHSEKTKQIMSEKQKGEGNSQFNTMWITDGKQNKKIKKTAPIPKGWWAGRV